MFFFDAVFVCCAVLRELGSGLQRAKAASRDALGLVSVRTPAAKGRMPRKSATKA